jgi:hypothetical protein
VIAVGVWLRTPPGIRFVLRVVDETGQTLQYGVGRPIYATDAAAWYRHVVPLGASESHWGGADDGVPHGAIASLAVLAADPLEAGATGAIDFDDVALFDELLAELDPATALRMPVPAAAAAFREGLGANIHFTRDDAALDALRGAGFRFVRMDLTWSAIETTAGVYDFSSWDDLLAALEARGMRAHLILDYGNDLHSDGPGWAPRSPAQVAAFGDFAEAAARHFAGRPVQYEVWNEPNIAVFWQPAPDAAAYAALAREAVSRVHAGDPAALVSVMGTSGIDLAFIRTALRLGAADAADAVGVHPYRQDAPETAADEVLLLRAALAETLPAPPPVWCTEWGYSSAWYGDGHAADSRKRQAVLAVREILTGWALGFPFHVYYDVRDDGTDPANGEHNFGLLADDYADKPAMVALRTLDEAARERTPLSLLAAAPSCLNGLELAGALDTVWVLWLSPPGDRLETRLPADAVVRDCAGADVDAPLVDGKRRVTLAEADGPVYVSLPLPPGPDADGDDAVDADSSAEAEAGADAPLDDLGAGDGDAAADVDTGAEDAAPPDAAGDGAADAPGSPGSGGGCACRTGGAGSVAERFLVLLALAVVVRRVRRGTA